MKLAFESLAGVWLRKMSPEAVLWVFGVANPRIAVVDALAGESLLTFGQRGIKMQAAVKRQLGSEDRVLADVGGTLEQGSDRSNGPALITRYCATFPGASPTFRFFNSSSPGVLMV